MDSQQSQVEKLVEHLQHSRLGLVAEGLTNFSKDVERLISRVKGMNRIIPSHQTGIYSILRMMLETNTYYDSKAANDLERAYELVTEALGENV